MHGRPSRLGTEPTFAVDDPPDLGLWPLAAERRTRPRPGWECPEGQPGAAARIPKLMQAYLSLGAEICSPPARDREFGTIDFLTWLDLDQLHPTAKRRFFT